MQAPLPPADEEQRRRDVLEAGLRETTARLQQALEELRWKTTRLEEAEALRASEAEFRVMAESMPQIVWITRADGWCTYFNQQWMDYTGLTLAASLGHEWNKAVHPEDQLRAWEAWQHATATTGVYSLEYRLRRADGDYRWWLVRGVPQQDAGGNVLKWFGTCTDIHDLKQAEQEVLHTNQALRESEERFAGAFEHAPIGVALVSPDGQWLKVNRALCKLVGYTEAELLTRTFQDITHPDDLAADLECVRQLLAGETRSYQMEKRYIHAGGHLVTVLLNVSLVRDAQDQPRYFIAQIQDITERKRTEQSLRLLSSAVEQSKESIMITDAELDLPGPRIIFVNPAFTQMTGHTATEAVGRTPRLLQGPRTDRAVLNRLRENLRQGDTFAGETVNYRKDGTEFDLEWQIAPLRDASGAITHFVAIQRDITERKRLEAQLLQSQKMETVGRLAGGVAHEFNSILTAIIGQSELLIGDLPTGGALAKNAAEIRKAADRTATLTRQLLAYGRRQLLKPEALDLNEVITGMSGMLHHLMGGEVNTQILPAPGLHAVRADAGQMEQVIMNMVINARDAMPGGGKLTLETANVTLDQTYVSQFPESELSAGDYVMLAITDSGTGMGAGVKARVFEPFFTTKGVGQGTGLGLSSCYGIIKQSGGHISVYSEPGRGTTFKIYLPQMAVQSQASARRPAPADLPCGTETILLVEDDPALREMAATLLRRLGYTVWVAANGIDALSLRLERGTGPVDLLFTDLVMPHMSGMELADRVQALDATTRVLFTSAYTKNAIIHQGMLKQGVTLLQKPFTPSSLARKLREVLDQPRHEHVLHAGC
ncbi:MAG TPA: hybrid sensor histidine kinase/response regulator [Verrucomicrobiales bacterium]|nr:hybrid sensor histidine kinase/response regulator [Verrucomicrobiales bacterium]